MSCAALVQNFGWNTLSIIPDSQPERPWSIADFSFNMAGMGVLEGIAQRLASDAVKLVPYDRVQVPGGTFHDQAESAASSLRKFVPHRVHGFGKVIRRGGRRPQVINGASALGNRLVGAFEGFFQLFLRLSLAAAVC